MTDVTYLISIKVVRLIMTTFVLLDYPFRSAYEIIYGLLSGNYLVDFIPGNTTGNYIITSDVQFLQVTSEQCAILCVQQQSSNCHGFYFCQGQMTCHLMLPESQANMVSAGVSSTSQDISCTFYYSKCAKLLQSSCYLYAASC